MTLAEFMAGDFVAGYRYELIDGKLSVSPQPNAPEGRVENWIRRKLESYSDGHPDVINYVHPKARVFVSRRRGVTNPEPDVAAYHDYPLDASFDAIDWQDVYPVLVVEVLSADDPDKDLVRNVELYLQVHAIKEYWLLDTRQGAEQPSLRVHRRHGRRWRIIDLDHGDTYTTKLLPGFELLIDPRQ